MLSCSAAHGQARPTAFCDQVRALTLDPTVAAAHWGVSVTTLEGMVLCALNEAQLFRPASNNKLFTIAAGLALLGPERRFTTSVQADGTLRDGVLEGNLRLLGGGDANLGSTDVPLVAPSDRPKAPPPPSLTIADIEDLADQIYAKGVRSISGDIVGDDTYFFWEPYPTGWEVSDLNAGFGAPVSALTINDSELEIDVAPGANAGAPAIISQLPQVSYYALNAPVTTSPPVSPDQRANHLRFERSIGSKTFVITGDIAAGSPPVKVHAAIHDPAEYAAQALKLALERRGVQIGGVAVPKHVVFEGISSNVKDDPAISARVKQYLQQPAAGASCPGLAAPAPTTILATHQSPRLADDVIFTAKESQNLHAEVLFRNLAATLGCDTTPSASMALLRAYLEQAGIAGGDLVLYDGSGLSGHDLVTPRSLTQLLVYATKQKWFDTFEAAMPVGGVDGTLAHRFTAPKSTLTGKVMAKTGTLGESRDLSGYVVAASGRTFVFSIMVDNHPPGSNADQLVMDRIVDAIAASN